MISSHAVHKVMEVYIVVLLKPAMLKSFVLIWRIIHYLCVDKIVGDSDAVERRCMDHVLTSE